MCLKQIEEKHIHEILFKEKKTECLRLPLVEIIYPKRRLLDVAVWNSPSMLSTDSCRPRLCCGFTTQWLLVAVMSNTSHPSSAAQIVRESSRNKSESLKKRSAISCYLGFPQGSLQSSHARVKQHARSAVQEQRRCWSWAGVLSYLITFTWSAFLLSLKKGGWVEAELRWFWITLLLQLTLELLMQLQKKCLPGTDLQNYCLHMQT